MESKYADILNALDVMQQFPLYCLHHDDLSRTERLIVNLERQVRELEAERDRLADMAQRTVDAENRAEALSAKCKRLEETVAAKDKLADAEDAALLDEIGNRDRLEDEIAAIHRALGGDGEWATHIPAQEPPHSGDLGRDALSLAEDLTAELKLWKPMTPEEAEAALDAAEGIPISDEEIERMVEFATNPANRLPESDQIMMAAKIKQLTTERDRLNEECSRLQSALDEIATQCQHEGQPIEQLTSGQPTREELLAENARLRHEIEVLRLYGNKDCTAMADDALTAELNAGGEGDRA